MKPVLKTLSDKLASDSSYFHKVYNHTFDLARNEGQRSLTLESAQAFWEMLLPYGLKGGALSYIRSAKTGEDVDMDSDDSGFQEEYVQWWLDFLNERGGKGVTKDTWQMLFEFIRTTDSRFSNYDMEAAWPSTIDDFVDYARKRLS
jgi:DCN1-like protein 1/2